MRKGQNGVRKVWRTRNGKSKKDRQRNGQRKIIFDMLTNKQYIVYVYIITILYYKCLQNNSTIFYMIIWNTVIIYMLTKQQNYILIDFKTTKLYFKWFQNNKIILKMPSRQQYYINVYKTILLCFTC